MNKANDDLDAVYALKTAEDNRRHYDGWAETYDSQFVEEMDYRLPERVAEAFAALGPDGPVLDVGAGTGLVGVRLAEVGRVWHEPRVCYHYRLHDASITHTQPSGRRIFFEQSVRRFALQRRESGADDLMRGDPPAPPEATGAQAAPDNARRQIAGQLAGNAWRQFRNGERRQALSLMARALTTDPGQPLHWRGMLSMLGRIALGRR